MEKSENPTYTYPWAMCAAGYGVLMAYECPDGDIEVFMAERLNRKTGKFEGYGITTGGFGEVLKLLPKPVGTISTAAQEIWREFKQELKAKLKFGFHTFKKNLFPLACGPFMVRTPDENEVHAVNYMGLFVTKQTRKALLAAGGSKETARLIAVKLNPAKPVKKQLAAYPLFHKHEIHAFEGLIQVSRGMK